MYDELRTFLDVDTKNRIYISGPMRGYDLYNFPAFDAAEDWLREHGWTPISPAAMDRAFGVTEYTPADTLPPFSTMIGRDIAILPTCGAIALIPGWMQSTGAKIEAQVAEWCALDAYYLDVAHTLFAPLAEVS